MTIMSSNKLRTLRNWDSVGTCEKVALDGVCKGGRFLGMVVWKLMF